MHIIKSNEIMLFMEIIGIYSVESYETHKYTQTTSVVRKKFMYELPERMTAVRKILEFFSIKR